MNTGQIIFSQVMNHLPMYHFHQCIQKYKGHHKVQKFSCLDQFLSMAFAQLTYRARFRKHKGAVKLHTLLDLRGSIPVFIHISDGKLHDVNVLDLLLPEPGAFYVMDKGYLDFARLFLLNQEKAHIALH